MRTLTAADVTNAFGIEVLAHLVRDCGFAQVIEGESLHLLVLLSEKGEQPVMVGDFEYGSEDVARLKTSGQNELLCGLSFLYILALEDRLPDIPVIKKRGLELLGGVQKVDTLLQQGVVVKKLLPSLKKEIATFAISYATTARITLAGGIVVTPFPINQGVRLRIMLEITERSEHKRSLDSSKVPWHIKTLIESAMRKLISEIGYRSPKVEIAIELGEHLIFTVDAVDPTAPEADENIQSIMEQIQAMKGRPTEKTPTEIQLLIQLLSTSRNDNSRYN